MRAVNLLPEGDRARGPAAVPAGSSRLVLGGLAALLLALIVVVVTQNQITTRKADIAEARHEQQQAEQRSAALGSFGEFSQIKNTRVRSISELANSRFDYERLMRELALVVPDGVWMVSAVASSTGEAEGTGGGSSTPPPATGAPAAAGAGAPSVKLTGCAKTQSQVAETMVRLRNLHRAEDVQLTDSTRPPEASSGSEGGEASDGGCGANYSFNTTVTFSASGDDDDASEGEHGDRVPGTLGGGA